MKNLLCVALLAACLLGMGTVGLAGEKISGDYLEARTCDVYTGPCFANAEVGLSGRNAVLAWHIEEGQWNGVDLAGLTVAAAVRANDTLGINGPLVVNPFPIKAMVFVDEHASSAQRKALVAFAQAKAGRVLENIVRVDAVRITFSINHVEKRGYLNVGEVAKIETRAVAKGDCVCSNETVFYPPLTDVEDAAPAVSVSHEFTGTGLGSTWKNPGKRSAFLATF